jgi:hypothetical protein
MTVRTVDSPWRLDDGDRALTTRWLTERVGAAVEQQSDLETRATAALHRRLMNSAPLRAVIYHVDLLALPIGGPS